jgi:hypothetical protein
MIIAILGVITWKSCIDLDPFKPLRDAQTAFENSGGCIAVEMAIHLSGAEDCDG